jgi:hypothetical protein
LAWANKEIVDFGALALQLRDLRLEALLAVHQRGLEGLARVVLVVADENAVGADECSTRDAVEGQLLPFMLAA